MLLVNNNISKKTITPEIAAELLGGNTKNRHVHERHVKRLCAAMLDGRWQFNGESIKIAKDGTLVDGQHRLIACVRTGIPFETIIVTGVDVDTYTTIDIGAKRTTSDALSREGIKNSVAVAGAIRWIKAVSAGKAHIGNIVLDPDEVLDAYAELSDLDGSIKVIGKTKTLLAPSVALALHYLFSRKNSLFADEFFDDLSSGENLYKGDPVLTLRNKLIEIRVSNKMKKYVTPAEVVALVIRAWNARRSGRSLTLVKGLVKNDAGELTMPTIE